MCHAFGIKDYCQEHGWNTAAWIGGGIERRCSRRVGFRQKNVAGIVHEMRIRQGSRNGQIWRWVGSEPVERKEDQRMKLQATSTRNRAFSKLADSDAQTEQCFSNGLQYSSTFCSVADSYRRNAWFGLKSYPKYLLSRNTPRTLDSRCIRVSQSSPGHFLWNQCSSTDRIRLKGVLSSTEVGHLDRSSGNASIIAFSCLVLKETWTRERTSSCGNSLLSRDQVTHFAHKKTGKVLGKFEVMNNPNKKAPDHCQFVKNSERSCRYLTYNNSWVSNEYGSESE